jgi:hypothetical protein
MKHGRKNEINLLHGQAYSSQGSPVGQSPKPAQADENTIQ